MPKILTPRQIIIGLVMTEMRKESFINTLAEIVSKQVYRGDFTMKEGSDGMVKALEEVAGELFDMFHSDKEDSKDG